MFGRRIRGTRSAPAQTAAAQSAAAQSAAAQGTMSPVEGSDVTVAGESSFPPVRVNAFRIGLVGGLGVLLSLLIGGAVTQLSTVLVYVGLALFIALGLDPLVSWLERKMPRGLAIAIVFAAVIGVFAGLLFTVIPLIVQQTGNFITHFPQIVSDFGNSDFVKGIEAQLGGAVDIDQAMQGATGFIQDPNNLLALGGGLLAVGSGIASGLTGSVIVLILTLYFLASLRSMKRVAYRFVPANKRKRFASLTEDVTGAVGRYVVGQVTLAAINGVLSFIYLSIIQAPLPVLFAFIAFLGSLIPLVGTLSGAVIITLVCLFASPTTALAAAIYYVIYMQVEAYVLSPRIMNRAVKVPGSIVVIAAVAGGALGSVLGALVAIPVAASAIIIIQKVVWPHQDAKTWPGDSARQLP
ncbi:AI-2E family transporter [Cnuibacter physcomitrellae]|uniref:AI-2E family transporter n=1 Tax=Cnuibacter physcomitrellae TaxID=1619308 RepID=A0A1X9LT01_9MICO|nr:AI-2E family transporter [Cnuibacter physcomitrellae]ARJ06279.1 AI-2E family transporter [Cnuibacter physcomitrellae]